MRLVFDIESNNLLTFESVDYTASPYKLRPFYTFWCAVAIDIDTEEVYEFVGQQEIQEKFIPMLRDKVTTLIGHNIIDFDMLALKMGFSDFDYEIGETCYINGREVEIIDTLVLSKVLNPDRYGGHSLDEWGKRLGLAKIDWRARAIELGLIAANAPHGAEFQQFHPEMVTYNRRDVEVNVKLYFALLEEMGDWPWMGPYRLELQVRDIITRQSHRGFKFNLDLALANVRDLDEKMEEIRKIVEPLLPPKLMGTTKLKAYLPPKVQFKKNGEPSANLIKFVEKHEGVLRESENGWVADIYGKTWAVPMSQDVPVKTHEPATVKDTTHIKGWLVEMGWKPSQYKERDLTCDSKKHKLSQEKFEETVVRYVEQTLNSPFCKDRCAELGIHHTKLLDKLLAHDIKRPLKVYTNPTITVGMDKEIDPNLFKLSDEFPHAKLVSQYLTYAHRRNSILGGGFDPDDIDDDDEFAGKGYMASGRIQEDGRIPTPADSCGAGCVTADTLILTDNGVVPIIDVGVGDLVLTHEGVYEKVVDRIQNGIKPVIRVVLDSGNIVTCTLNHPFRVNGGWVKAEDLKIGTNVTILQEQEKWGKLKGYSNYYISSWGRVIGKEGRPLKTVKRRELWERANVDLIDDYGKKHREGIGRLVLKCFVGEPQQNQETLHADNNPTNNFLSNLSWGTSKENTEDQKVHGVALKASRTRRDGKLTVNVVAEVKQYFRVNGYTRGDDSLLAKKYGVSRELIGGVRTGKRWAEGNESNLFVQNFITAKVVSLEELSPVPTYDITVENSHSYVANGVVTHNTSRMKHKLVANIPRITSLYGDRMRGMFGVDVEEGFIQMGYDFDSLEAKIEAHYVYKYPGGPEYGESLTAEKPNDCHSVLARMISGVLGREFPRSTAKNVKYGCLPVDNTEVLTRDGWKRYGQIGVGDFVVGYHAETKEMYWTEVTGLHFYENADVGMIGNKRWNVEATQDHRWLAKNAYSDEIRLVYTDDLNTASSILNAAVFKDRGSVKNDAALVGWLLSDGYWKWSTAEDCRQNKYGEKLGVTASVGQKKFCADVEVALYMAKVDFTVYEHNGVKEYRIDPEDFRQLARRNGFYGVDKHDVDWTKYVLGLDSVNRSNFILSFWQADGRQGATNATVVRQRPGGIADAVALAMSLDGMKTTVRVDGEGMATINGSRTAYTGFQTGSFTPTRKADVFCLSTACESFFIRQGGVLTLTGNCSYNAQPPRVAKTIGCSLEDAQLIFDTFWTQAAPLKGLKENMQKYWETTGQKKFLLGLDKRKLPIRSKGNVINTAFQSAGVICAKRAMVIHENMLKKEGMYVDFFRDDWKNKDFVQQLIAYHK